MAQALDQRRSSTSAAAWEPQQRQVGMNRCPTAASLRVGDLGCWTTCSCVLVIAVVHCFRTILYLGQQAPAPSRRANAMHSQGLLPALLHLLANSNLPANVAIFVVELKPCMHVCNHLLCAVPSLLPTTHHTCCACLTVCPSYSERAVPASHPCWKPWTRCGAACPYQPQHRAVSGSSL